MLGWHCIPCEGIFPQIYGTFGSIAMSNRSFDLSGCCLSLCSVISTKAPSSHQTHRFDKSMSSHSEMAIDDVMLLTSSRLIDATRKLVEMFPNGLDDYVGR